MSCHIFKNPVKRAGPEWFMKWDSDVMFLPVHDRGKSLVAAGLVIDTISLTAETAGESVAIDITGQFHTAISSSFTM